MKSIFKFRNDLMIKLAEYQTKIIQKESNGLINHCLMEALQMIEENESCLHIYLSFYTYNLKKSKPFESKYKI